MAVKTLADAAPDEVHFAELRRRMPGVSQKMLSVTLRSLTRDGLVSRRVEPTVPPRVSYRLTGLGLSLEAALAGLRTGRRSTWPRSTAPTKPPTRRPMRGRQAGSVLGTGGWGTRCSRRRCPGTTSLCQVDAGVGLRRDGVGHVVPLRRAGHGDGRRRDEAVVRAAGRAGDGREIAGVVAGDEGAGEGRRGDGVRGRHLPVLSELHQVPEVGRRGHLSAVVPG